MNLAEAADLLAKVQAYDRRQVDRPQIAAWQEALADVSLAAASAAVADHFASSTDWLMPGHVRRLAAVRSSRILAEVGPPDYPEAYGDLPPAEQQAAEKAYRAAYHSVVLAGYSREDAHKAADGRLGVVRPELKPRPVQSLTVGRRPE